MSEACIFERILTKELPANIVYEDEDILAFQDIAPQAPVHILVIPKLNQEEPKLRSFADLADSNDLYIGKLFRKAAIAARQLGLEEQGYRVISNCGSNAGQSVFYLHLHILSGCSLPWPPH